MFQRHALEILHGDEGLAVLLANVVNRADVRMIERRSRLRLALKAAEGVLIACHLVRQELQSDEAVQPCVLSFVDYPHATAAQFLDDAVVRDSLADHGVPESYGLNCIKSIKAQKIRFASLILSGSGRRRRASRHPAGKA